MDDSLRPVLRATAICDLLGGMLGMQKTIGATAIQAIENGVQFSFEGCEFANKVQITETKPTVYELEFWHFSPYTHDTIFVNRLREVKDLARAFTEFTKLQLTKSEKPANLPPPPSATFKPKEKTKTTLF